MITPELLRVLYEYNAWANQRTLDACALLTNEQFTRDLGSSFGSVRDTLAHIYGAEWVWSERVEGRAPSTIPSGSSFPDLTSVRAKLEEMDRHFIDYTARVTPEQLARVIHYKSFTGAELANPLWQSLQHLVNHGTYHRGQIVTLLRQIGVKAVSTDMIGFYREQAARATA